MPVFKLMKRKNPERFWWAVLVRANEQMCVERSRDIDAFMLAREVDLVARRELVNLGLNLDNIFPSADKEFQKLYKKAEARAEQDRKASAEIDRLLGLLKGP